MPNTCGLAVGGLWVAEGKCLTCTHSYLTAICACVQSYGILDSLYHFCTQVLHSANAKSASVKSLFYTLSTQPIKTTTDLKKGL